MSHHINIKVKPNKTKYLIIIRENQIYDIYININKKVKYVFCLSSLSEF